MPPLFDTLLSLLLPALILLHLLAAPYTKVEESFNIQAAHDILQYGAPFKGNVAGLLRRQYDHFDFPGAVPRTFVGAVVTAGGAQVLGFLGLCGSGVGKQVVVRGVLGMFNAGALLFYRDGVKKASSRGAGNWYILIHASQFHLMYYASRTLPNMFAFGLCTIALRGFLPIPATASAVQKRQKLSIYLLTFTGVVFRSELALLLGSHILYQLLQSRISLTSTIIPVGAAGAFVGLLTTVSVDTFFWQSPIPIWPELTGFWYNAIEGKSVAWGTSPWHFYFSNALPRLLMNPVATQIGLPLALALKPTRKASADIIIPLLAFVAVYSIQPHKEWRFVVYTLPGLTAVAAIGTNWIWTRRQKSMVYGFLSLALIASTIGSLGASLGMLAVSRLNYPGAVALERVHVLASGTPRVRLHMDTLTCMTGVTRFLQQEGWAYDKTEDERLLLDPRFWGQFDWVLAERSEKVIGAWEIVETVDGFAGVGILKPGEKSAADLEKGLKGTGGEKMPANAWKGVEDFAREKITQGWWVGVKMEPKIRILRREKNPVGI